MFLKNIFKPTICFFIPNISCGGAERSVISLANEFSKLGLKVDFLIANSRADYKNEISDHVRLIDFGARGVLGSLPQLTLYLRTERPTVLVSALNHANVIAAIAVFMSSCKIRHVMLQRSTKSHAEKLTASNQNWFAKQLDRWAYKRAKLIIGNSQFVITDLNCNFHISHARLTYVLNSVDLDLLDQLSTIQIPDDFRHISNSQFILAVGSLTLLKNFEILLEGFAILYEHIPHYLVILGEGPLRESLMETANRLKILDRLVMPGFDANPFRWMKKASVLVSSSLTEGCPNVIQQALACGTPIVATDCPGGTSEILEGGKWGRLVPVGNPQAMAEAIIATLQDKSHPDGRMRAADFDPRKNAKEYLKLILPDFIPHPTPTVVL